MKKNFSKKLQDILSANPQSHNHKIMLAHTYLLLARRFRESALSNIKEAERIVAELERLNPAHGEIIEARIHTLLTRKNLTKAQNLFLTLPGNSGVLTDYLKGLSAYLRKDRNKITRSFDKTQIISKTSA